MTLMFMDAFGTAWPLPVDRIRSLKSDPANNTEIRRTDNRRVEAVRLTLEFEKGTFLQVYVRFETAAEIVNAMTGRLVPLTDYSPSREYQMIGGGEDGR